jgi:hypothetical protein
MQEVSVNSSLMREMRAVAFVNKLIDQGRMTGGKQILVHVIEAEDAIGELPNSSRLNAAGIFCCIFMILAEDAPSIGSRQIVVALASNQVLIFKRNICD